MPLLGQPYTPLDASGIDDPPIESVSLEQIAGELAAGLGRARFTLGTARITGAYTSRTIAQAISQLQLRRLLRRPQGVPKDWIATPLKKGKGMEYAHPKESGTYIRIKKGESNSSLPGQRYDNVRIQRNGQSYDANGNPVAQRSLEAHIPIKDFTFPTELFK